MHIPEIENFVNIPKCEIGGNIYGPDYDIRKVNNSPTCTGSIKHGKAYPLRIAIKRGLEG